MTPNLMLRAVKCKDTGKVKALFTIWPWHQIKGAVNIHVVTLGNQGVVKRCSGVKIIRFRLNEAI